MGNVACDPGMGSCEPDTNQPTQDMECRQFSVVGAVVLCMGLVSGDSTGSGLVSAGEGLVTNSLYPDTVYHNTANLYPTQDYDYDTHYPNTVDRQEEELFLGGLSVTVLGTAFVAALAGALVAPVFRAGFDSMMEFELPEITLPELPVEAVEEVRSLEEKYPWVGALDIMYRELREQVNRRKSTQFNKFNNINTL